MADKLNILVLQPDFSQYGGAYYHHQFTMALSRVHQIFRYGKGLPDYDTAHTIEDVLKLCPFEPDLICFAAGWEIESIEISEFDPHPAINVSGVDIPSVMVLNKEYKKLDRKFQFINDNEIRLVFTVHHHYDQWAAQTGVKFIHFPFAVDERMFRDYGEPKRYDFGFSGRLHDQWTDIRARIKDRIFLKRPVKRPRFWRTRIYWSEGRIPKLRLPTGEAYVRLINRSKMWLSSPSALDIVGTRFYEIMATKTLLFCNRSPAYSGLFEDDVHCVMFDSDLSDFDERLIYYLQHGDEREAIVETGYKYVLENHTWDRRIEQFTDNVKAIL